jgi:hypothetical protein
VFVLVAVFGPIEREVSGMDLLITTIVIEAMKD